ncbi:hypothetical protein BMB171_C3323 [Bacillus thuringiensis BMB171]|nr:hypothetical protein BMB171_C3323 [Bacillus thuringiensis BMB171]
MIKCMCFSVNVCFNNLVAFSRCFHCCDNLLRIHRTHFPRTILPTFWNG